MNDDFDLVQAERVLVSAQSALGKNHAPDRIAQFGTVTAWFGKSLTEVKRLHVSRAAMVADALAELNGLMLGQLEDALRRRGSLVDAVREFRERNYYLKNENGKWRWAPKPDSDIHAALEKLIKAMLEAERSVQ